jgi:2-keto-4-pentenoate hydratase/2-oxohepta-3-ene-1,7-dioic acid hydratase in catechol pathway
MAGDVLGSGTCGTGCISELSLTHGEDKYPWLKPGDRVDMQVELLGTLSNTVAAGPPLHPLR